MQFENQNVVVIGGSRGVGRAIIAAVRAQGARALAVARRPEPLAQLEADFPGVLTLSMDAAHENAPAQVFETLHPNVLVICGGAIPAMGPLQAQTWEGFSRDWNADVRMSFLFCQAVLLLPLSRGATIILISSGAGLGGSAISGGYSGAKRMQMFMADYCQQESDRLGLGLRFAALAPRRIMPDTDLGKVAIAGYSEYLGISPSDFIKEMDSPRTAPDDVAKAVMALVTAPQKQNGNVFTVSENGIEVAS